MTEARTNGRRAAALITVLAVAAMATGCGGGDDAAAPDAATATTLAVGMEPELPTADTTRDDTFDHVIVITINSPTVDSPDLESPDLDSPDLDSPDLDSPDSSDGGSGGSGVLGPDGAVRESDLTESSATDTESSDTQPSDTQPSDTQPSDTQPRVQSTLPVSTVPAAATSTTGPAAAASGMLATGEIEVASMSLAATPLNVDPSSSTELQVERLDGTTERVRVPDGSLPTARLLTDAESQLLDSYADQPLAVLVQDVSGVVGPVGRRYVMVPGRLIEVGTPTSPTTTEPQPSTPEVEPPTTTIPATTTTTTSAPATTEPPVVFGPPTDEEILEVILELPGLEAAEIVAPGLIAVATSGRRDDLLSVDGVVGVETDTLFDLAADPQQDRQWMLANSGAPEQAGGWPGVPGADANAIPAWGLSTGAGVVVAVIDSGVDIDHPDLAARVWTNTDEVCSNGVDDDANGFVDDCRGWDFGDGDNDPNPQAGLGSFTDHGTHVAGIVAGAMNGVGVVGMAPDAQVMALKVGRGGGISQSSVAGAIVYAADNGADVINLSLATGPNTSRAGVATMEQAIAYAGQRGALVVAGAGNNNVDVSAGPAYPAGFSMFYDHVMSIGATTNSDTRASFSNYGSTVTLWAPGFFIWSTVVDGHNWMSGTSMSTPVVAGAAAVLIGTGQATSPAEVRTRFIERANATAVGPRLDLGAAVGLDLPPAIDMVVGGADTLVADQPGAVSLDLTATNLPVEATQVRISVAAQVDGQVYAVTGFPTRFTRTGGSTVDLVTDAQGAFAPLAIDDATALATSGWSVDGSLTLPAGDFAIVTELLSAAGDPIDGARVTYLSVGTSSGAGSNGGGSTVTTVAPGNPLGTAPTTTLGSGSGGGSGSATPTTTPGSGAGGTGGTDSTLPQVSTTAPRSGTGSGSGTTAPPATAPGAGVPVTTSPTASPVTTAPVTATTTPSPATTSVTQTTSPSAPGATPTTTPAPTTTTPAPTTTTPAPPPVTSGQWRLDSISPRSGSTIGGTNVVLDGRFPTTVPIYVWFGSNVVQAQSNGATLVAVSPPAAAGTTDVSVRFRTTSDHVLLLPAVYTYVAPSSGGGSGSGSGSGPATTVAAPPGTQPGSGGASPTTTQPGSGGASPTTAPPTATTTPAPTTPTPTSPTPTPTTSPTATAAPVPPVPPVPPVLGNLTLATRPSSGALSRLSPASWPASGCRQATCSASSL